MKKYISIDLETTGLNPETCQILSFGAVIEDRDNKLPLKDLPKFHRIIKRDFIQGEPYALDLNKDIIQVIKEGIDSKLIPENRLIDNFRDFLIDNDFDVDHKSYALDVIKINVAGKNFNGFDKRFLEKIPSFLEVFKINHRVLDPAALYLQPEDKWLPNLQTCMERAGIETEVTHDALQDAVDVIKVLRYKNI